MAKQEEALYVPLASGDQLYVKRICGNPAGVPVLMVHGAMANGRIFYSDKGKGLAHFLADAGYDVFVADLRGRGRSTPAIGPFSQHGQTETICQDLPALQAAIRERKGPMPVHWIAHSWGGVYMSSCLLRYPELAKQVASLVYFGAKRGIGVRNINKLLEIDLLWNRVARGLIRRCGYLPAKRFGFGADSETAKNHQQISLWASQRPWRDSDDGFDYAAAALQVSLPPVLYFAARHDPCRGHVQDVQRFCAESGPHFSRIRLLGKAAGHWHDYNHVSMLTHPDANRDHFPMVLDWLAGQHDKILANF